MAPVVARPALRRAAGATRAAAAMAAKPAAGFKLPQPSPAVKTALAAAGAQLLAAAPASAAAGKLFDFDATLPIMAGEILLLMVVLDKTWFTPVGKVLDDRDEKIRGMISGVQDNTDDITKMEEEAKQVVADARASASAMVASAKAEAETSSTEELAKLKKTLDAEYTALLSKLVDEQEQAKTDLQPKVKELADSIVGKLIPA